MVTLELIHPSSPLRSALRKALLLGAVLLLTPAFAATPAPAAGEPATKPTAAARSQTTAKPKAAVKPTAAATPKVAASAQKADTKAAASKKADKKAEKKAVAKAHPEDQKPGPMADFGKVEASSDVVHVANWVSHTRNNQKKAFVLIDKKQARLYVFDQQGKLKSHTAVLLGKAVGDHSAPGIGNKPLSQIKEEEKTTPAGRFLARPGKNHRGEDIIWIDYDAAVSMHRLRQVGNERRAERLATADIGDNRISSGCVNVPHNFYNSVLKPTVMKQGAMVYVLPETKTPQQQFGSVDVAAR